MSTVGQPRIEVEKLNSHAGHLLAYLLDNIVLQIG